MANLRRHFNFTTKTSIQQDREIPFLVNSPGKPSYRHFDKNNLMNDICNCVKLCCEYIQALNTVCEAGSLLARTLFHTVREAPAFQNVSLQFLNVWEEVSRATAGASAAVKTETLMMLQEIMNSLEMGKNEADAEGTVAESFQGIGTCLFSFIELQSQFSLSTWKAFSKLSKHFTSDSVRHSLQWKSLEKTSKIVVNTDLNATIKKNFSHLVSKVGMAKANENLESHQSHYCLPANQVAANVSVYSPFSNRNIPDETIDNSVWSSQPATWSSTVPSQESHSAEQDSSSISSKNSDLDEVINLLSCVPVDQCTSKLNDQNQNYFQYCPSSEQMYHMLPKASLHSPPRGLESHRSWPNESRDIAVGFEPLLWRIDNMNCTGLQVNTDGLNLSPPRHLEYAHHFDSQELQKWNNSMCETGSSSDDGSSVQGPDTEYLSCGMNASFGKYVVNSCTNRKYNSIESMPGGLENISESKEELWAVQSKISTWPLKQSTFRNSDVESQDKTEYLECPNSYMSSF